MSETPWKAGDDEPLEADLLDGEGNPLPLAQSAGVALAIRPRGSADPADVAACEVANARWGRTRFPWPLGPLTDPGLYELEWTVTWQDGTRRTVPTEAPELLNVLPTLA